MPMRSFANIRARSYDRDELAITYAKMTGFSFLHERRALDRFVQIAGRDVLINHLRELVRERRGGNGIRAAYIAERLAQLRDRKTERLLEADLKSEIRKDAA